MGSKNYKIGASFESRFLKKLLKDEKVILGGRFYASKGICDVWWVNNKGVYSQAQLKYSTIKKPYISPKEIQRLRQFAREMPFPVWLVTKQKGKKIVMELVE